MTLSTSIKTLAFASLLALAPAQMMAAQKGGTFTTGDKTFLLNGKPFVVKAAELHYPRIPRAYWEHRIKMCKALGMNTVCLYVFWNIHEQEEGKFDFTGNNDVAAFCRLAQKNGMYVIVRPGPYVCAEWEMGGLPWWLLKKKDIRLREQDPYFMQRNQIVTGMIKSTTINIGYQAKKDNAGAFLLPYPWQDGSRGVLPTCRTSRSRTLNTSLER
jgi:beta-galactosidase